MQPKSEAELADLLAAAQHPVAIRGGGTRPIGRAAAGEVLSTVALTGVTLYEPGALTLVAQAGTPVAEIEATLAAENQRLPFEPMDHRALLGTEGTPTIGGVVAGNVSGPRRIQAGAARDSLIGVRFVDGAGTVIKNGGRVMKNVTGYDLVKLMAGSYGTLGVLSEVSFKLLPEVEASACLILEGLDDARAIAALARALASPYEVTGAAHIPNRGGTSRSMIRLEGFSKSVAYRADALRALLADFAAVEVITDTATVRQIWKDQRDVTAFAGQSGDVWRISCKPSDGSGLAAKIKGDIIYDWGGGLIWAMVPEGYDLRASLGAFAGHATLIRASEGTRARIPTFHPEPAPLAALSEGLRRKFDPKGILNTGLMATAMPAA
ncbi:FAD-binding protein [Rhodobacteraceae bacterium XHP0102]|nr:FAD-binding protein [Rhodobacteraceae bacterium XHP0102]